MNWSDIPRQPSPRTLRQFSLLCVLISLGAGWQQDWSSPSAPGVLALALLLGVGAWGLVRPQRVRPLFVGWLMLTFPLRWCVSNLVLSLVYFGLFTPLGLWFRLIGRDALGLRRQPERQTYWATKPQSQNVAAYFRQY
ncbi:MAG: hypothetical protein JNM56_03730 [Planctomycetia bacterium]|nr:hypothetical protein [Planctomycetia bacterium]